MHKVHNASELLLRQKHYIAPVDLLLELQVLSKKDYENWRKGKVQYLEQVCHTNLSKLSFIMKELRAFSQQHGLKQFWTAYLQWGSKKPLRFSKSNNSDIEKAYSTHHVAGIKPSEGRLKYEPEHIQRL